MKYKVMLMTALLVFYMNSWSQSNQSDFSPSFQVINYDNLDAVKRYKKLEIGVTLPQEIKERVDLFLLKKGDKSKRLNPFVEWDLDVEATFYHVETGEQRSIDGFYTRDFLRVVDTLQIGGRTVIDDWVDVDSLDGRGNLFPFRIRFSPPLNGDWKVEVSIKVKKELYHKFNDVVEFHVVESGDPGFVKVHPNQKNLMRGDEMIFPIGHNLLPTPGAIPWGGNEDYLGKNHFSYRNTEKAANTKSWDYYLNQVARYFNEGGKYIRDLQSPWMSLIEFEEKGNYFKRLHYAQEMDSLVQLCEQYGALMNFNLFIHEPIMKYGDYDMSAWDWGHYNEHGEKETIDWKLRYPRYCYNDKPFGEKEPHEMFLNEDDLNYHKQRTRYYMSRYGYSTSIYTFEIMSEPFHLNENASSHWSDFKVISPFHQPSTEKGKEVRYAVYNYHKVLSEYMRDSLNINQLIGIDMGVGMTEEYHDYSFDSLSITIPSIDIVGINYYYLNPDGLFLEEGYGKQTSVHGNTYDLSGNAIASKVEKIRYIHDFHNGKKIPVLVSEGGIAESFLACTNYSQFYVDLMSFPFSNVAGYNAWHGWEDGKEELRRATVRTEAFVNGSSGLINVLDEGQGNWKHNKKYVPSNSELRSGSRFPKETQYYIAENKEKAVGYVRNLTYNVRTTGEVMVHIDSTCLQRARNSTEREACYTEDFTCVDYSFEYPGFNEIDWFDYRKGKKIKIQDLKIRESYCIDFYAYNHEDFNMLNRVRTDCGKTNRRGEMTLKFPVLDPWNKETGPVLWFIVRNNN